MADRVEHVGDRRIALQIDEVLREVVGGRVPVRDARGHVAGCGADDREPGRPDAVGDEACPVDVPAQPAADAAPELRRRVPAAGDEHEVRVERVDLAARPDQRDRSDTSVAVGGQHRPSDPHVDPAVASRVGGPSSLARIDDRGDLEAVASERRRRLVPGVIRAEHDGALPRQHAEAVGVQRRGRGEHHAGQVVAPERDRSLVGAGRQHDPPCPHVVDTFDGGRSLVHHDIPVVVDPERRGIGEDGDLRRARERASRRHDPRQRGLAVDVVAGRRRTPDPGALVDEHHAVSRLCRLQRGPESRRSPRRPRASRRARVDVAPQALPCRRRGDGRRRVATTRRARRRAGPRSPARSGGTPAPRLPRTHSALPRRPRRPHEVAPAGANGRRPRRRWPGARSRGCRRRDPRRRRRRT